MIMNYFYGTKEIMTKQSKHPLLLFTDFDGTLYDPSMKIVLSPLYNSHTTQILKKLGSKFIIVTGRSQWGWFDELQLKMLRLPRPDMVIYGAGTHILHKNDNQSLLPDSTWEDLIAQTEVSWVDSMAKSHHWQKNLIEETLQTVLDQWMLKPKPTTNPYLISIPITNLQVKQVKKIIDQLKMTWEKGVKILLTEKLYLPNTITLFNGYLLLVPDTAGKENAVTYVLKNYYKNAQPNALFFGDALVDVPMLSLDTTPLTNTSYSYGVHMTPLARENMKIEDPKSKIVHFPGSAPKAFRDIIKAYATGNPIAAQQHAKLVEPA